MAATRAQKALVGSSASFPPRFALLFVFGLFTMASSSVWTGSEPELVGTDGDGGATSTEWEVVPEKEVKVEVDEEVQACRRPQSGHLFG